MITHESSMLVTNTFCSSCCVLLYYPICVGAVDAECIVALHTNSSDEHRKSVIFTIESNEKEIRIVDRFVLPFLTTTFYALLADKSSFLSLYHVACSHDCPSIFVALHWHRAFHIIWYLISCIFTSRILSPLHVVPVNDLASGQPTSLILSTVGSMILEIRVAIGITAGICFGAGKWHGTQ